MEGDVEPEIPRSQITWPHINWKSRLCRRIHDKVEFHYSHSVVMASVERVMRHVALKLHDLGWYLISDYKNPGKERSSNRSKSLTQISLHRHLATLTFRASDRNPIALASTCAHRNSESWFSRRGISARSGVIFFFWTSLLDWAVAKQLVICLYSTKCPTRSSRGPMCSSHKTQN